ncbi:MAG: thioredoxin domain-containing protein [Halioglobus sp.]|nr:thioredoxin domain-containing protein [Halioglobus sp.]MDG2327298.1 thioredoxin domain-containing protein [Halioglobus sp.]
MYCALRNLASLTLVLAIAACGSSDPGPSSTGSLDPDLVREYLLMHPEIVLDDAAVSDAIHKAGLRRKQGRAAEERRSILKAYTDLLQSPLTPSSGGKDAGITVIEFYDYQCAPCRASYPELQQVRATEPGVRYLYGQLPIYGSHSIMAARAAVAAHRQGIFKEFHHALMTTDSGLDMKVIFATAEKAGLDVEKLQADMRDPLVHQYLEEIRALAEALDITGTPSFIIGDAKLSGGVTAGDLMSELDRQRAQIKLSSRQ